MEETGATQERPGGRSWGRRWLRPKQLAGMTSEQRFEYAQFLSRVVRFVRIKAVINVLVVVLYLLVLPPDERLGPTLVAVCDGLLLIPFTLLVRRWPVASTYGVLSATAVAISAADLAAGHQTGTSGVLYAILIVAGAVLLIHTRGIAIVTGLITGIYVLTLTLEGLVKVLPVEMHLTTAGLIRVMSLHAFSFLGLGALSRALAQLYRQLLYTRGQRGLLSALLEGFQEISGDLHLHTLLQRVAERAVSTIPAAGQAVLLVREADLLVVRGVGGYGDDAPLLGWSLPVERLRSHLGELSNGSTGRWTPLHRVVSSEELAPLDFLPAGRRTAVLPLLVKGDLRGLLTVTNVDGSDGFSADTQRILHLFAHQAAIAMENARLFTESQSRLQEALTLHRIGREIASLLEMHDLVPVIYRHIQEAMEAPSLLIAVVDPRNGEIVILSPVDAGRTLPDMVASPEGILGWVIRHQQVVRWGEIEDDLTDHPEIRSRKRGFEEPTPRSLLAVPLLVADQVVGALSVQSPNPSAYGESDERLLSSLASYVAVAVQNARLYDEVQQNARALQQQQEELRGLIAAVSERLQRPVEALAGFASLLKDDAAEALKVEQEDFLTRIQRNSRWISDLIRDMLFLSRMDGVDEEREPVALTTLVRGVATHLELEQQGIAVHIQEAMPVLLVDSVLMWTCLRNLLQNAQRLLGDVGSPTLEVGCDLLTDSYRLYVAGNGAALPPDDLERVFEVFFPTDAYSAEEPALGLAIARRIGRRYGGRVWAESQPDRGTVFWVLLPRELVVDSQEALHEPGQERADLGGRGQ